MDVSSNTTARTKFVAAIQSFESFSEGSTPKILFNWSKKGPRGATKYLYELLVDVEITAERAQNKKPIQKEGPRDREAELKFTRELQEWKDRAQANKLPKDHALLLFLDIFKPFWVEFSPHAFTEGMHFEEVGETVSECVDAIESILVQIDPSVTRKSIVTAIKKAKVASYAQP